MVHTWFNVYTPHLLASSNCVYIHIRIHTYTHTHIYIYIYIYVCVYIYIYIYICIYIYIYLDLSIYIVYVHIYIYIYIFLSLSLCLSLTLSLSLSCAVSLHTNSFFAKMKLTETTLSCLNQTGEGFSSDLTLACILIKHYEQCEIVKTCSVCVLEMR